MVAVGAYTHHGFCSHLLIYLMLLRPAVVAVRACASAARCATMLRLAAATASYAAAEGVKPMLDSRDIPAKGMSSDARSGDG